MCNSRLESSIESIEFSPKSNAFSEPVSGVLAKWGASRGINLSDSTENAHFCDFGSGELQRHGAPSIAGTNGPPGNRTHYSKPDSSENALVKNLPESPPVCQNVARMRTMNGKLRMRNCLLYRNRSMMHQRHFVLSVGIRLMLNLDQ